MLTSVLKTIGGGDISDLRMIAGRQAELIEDATGILFTESMIMEATGRSVGLSCSIHNMLQVSSLFKRMFISLQKRILENCETLEEAESMCREVFPHRRYKIDGAVLEMRNMDSTLVLSVGSYGWRQA